MPDGLTRRVSADVPLAVGASLAFVAYVWVLMHATVPLVTAFAFASDGRPKLYAAFLAGLAGLPGLLLTLPRAFAPPVPAVQPSVRSRRQASALRRSYVRTDGCTDGLGGVSARGRVSSSPGRPASPARKAA